MKIKIMPDKPLAVPVPNMGGTDWGWRDVEGNQLIISNDGSIMTDAIDEWIDLTAEQWAEIAAVALSLASIREVNSTPTVEDVDVLGTLPLPIEGGA